MKFSGFLRSSIEGKIRDGAFLPGSKRVRGGLLFCGTNADRMAGWSAVEGVFRQLLNRLRCFSSFVTIQTPAKPNNVSAEGSGMGVATIANGNCRSLSNLQPDPSAERF